MSISTVRKSVFASLLTLTLISCGGGSDGESKPTPVTIPPPANTAPTVVINSPGPDIVIEGDSLNIQTEVTDTDGSIQSVTASFASNDPRVTQTVTLTESTTKGVYEYSLDLTSTPDDSYSLSITATDDDGDETSVTVKVTVKKPENVPPELQFPFPADGDTITGFVLEVVTTSYDPDGTIMSELVIFKCGDDIIFQSTSVGVERINIRDVPNGTCTIKATLEDDDGAITEKIISITIANETTRFKDFKVTPEVILNDKIGTEELTFTGSAIGDIECMVIYLRLHKDARVLKQFEMCDNGEDGDIQADDNSFSKTISLNLEKLGLRGYPTEGVNQIDSLLGEITFLDKDRNTLVLSEKQEDTRPRFSIGVLESGNLVPVTQLTDTMRATSHVVNIVVPESFGWEEDTHAVTKQFCEYFSNLPFDYINISTYLGTTVYATIGGAYHVRVSNDVKGIGYNIFSDYFESLEGYSYGCPSLFGIGVATSLYKDGFAVIHEFGHSFASYSDNHELYLVNTTATGFESSASIHHWGHASKAICEDPMSDGYCLTEMDDGLNLKVNARSLDRHLNQFSLWTLYLMGLVPADEVPGAWFYTDPNGSLSRDQILSKDDPAIEYVTVKDNYVRIYGDRIPLVGQKEFRVGCIAVSTEPLSQVEMAFETLKCEYLGSNKPSVYPITEGSLNWATRGLATFKTPLH